MKKSLLVRLAFLIMATSMMAACSWSIGGGTDRDKGQTGATGQTGERGERGDRGDRGAPAPEK